MVKKIKYKVRKGARIKKDRVQVYGEELARIQVKHKIITPEIIVKEASKKSSKLHDYFDWDDAVAGKQWRLVQARHLIGNIEETVIVDGKRDLIRSFFNVHNAKKEKIYVTLEQVTHTLSYRNQIIDKIIRDMESASKLLKLLRDIK